MNRTQLADAMIEGWQIPGVIENRTYYIGTVGKLCHACALGIALIGHYNGEAHEAAQVFYHEYDNQYLADEVTILSRLLGIPYELAIEVEHLHLNGQSIKDIADWLKFSNA